MFHYRPSLLPLCGCDWNSLDSVGSSWKILVEERRVRLEFFGIDWISLESAGRWLPQAIDRGFVHVEGPGDVSDGLAFRKQPRRHLNLVRIQLARTAKADTAPFGRLASSPGSLPDQIPFELRDAGENGHDHLSQVNARPRELQSTIAAQVSARIRELQGTIAQATNRGVDPRGERTGRGAAGPRERRAARHR